MNKKSNKKLMAGLISLITLIIIGITCSGFLSNFKEGIKFLGISFGISAGLVLLLFIMKYIIKGADKLVGEGRTFNDRAIVLFSILILVSLTCRGFLKNFTLGIVFLIVSIAFVAITFLIMYGINSKKGAIKKAILAEKTSGEKMFILLTVLILISLTCGGFIQNLKAGILFLIVSIISSLALYLTVTEVKNENSIISKIIRIETTFNQKMMILLSTITMVSLTCGGFLRNLRAGIVFLMISIVFTTSMLMLVLGVKSKHKIYDKIAGFETTFNEKMIILLTTMAMVSITSGGFLYNFKLGMLFLTISLIFSSLVLAGVISVRPRVNIFKMRARIQNLGKKEAIRAFGMIFACVFVVFNLSGTWAYFTNTDENGNEVEAKTDIKTLTISYDKSSSSGGSGGGSQDDQDSGNSSFEDEAGLIVHYDNTDSEFYRTRIYYGINGVSANTPCKKYARTEIINKKVWSTSIIPEDTTDKTFKITVKGLTISQGMQSSPFDPNMIESGITNYEVPRNVREVFLGLSEIKFIYNDGSISSQRFKGSITLKYVDEYNNQLGTIRKSATIGSNITINSKVAGYSLIETNISATTQYDPNVINKEGIINVDCKDEDAVITYKYKKKENCIVAHFNTATKKWNPPKIWAWSSSGGAYFAGSYPGPAMNSEGNDWWYYEFDTSNISVKVSNPNNSGDAMEVDNKTQEFWFYDNSGTGWSTDNPPTGYSRIPN